MPAVQFPPVCPKCGSEGACFGHDVGGVDRYDDEYSFRCFECGYSDTQTISGGSPLGPNDSTNCPYCRRSNFAHTAPPEAFVEPGQIRRIDVRTGDIVIIDWKFRDSTTFPQIVFPHMTKLVDGKRVLAKHYYEPEQT